ncbi:MAG: T9SS type A sorting domain-containing protein [Saprospiraceae bacterium]|nr:T9SS type A sorting domain-containing protein [Saprospiraceae bacterium]
MKFNYSYILILFSFSIFGQGIQGTIVKTGPLQVTVYARNATMVTPTSANATVYNIGLKILKGGLSSAPTLSISTMIGGTVGTLDIIDDGTYYSYETVVNGANYPVSAASAETVLYTATFSSEAGGKYVRLIHDENSNNAFFDIVIPGYANAMNSAVRFYGGGIIDNTQGNSFVEAASPLPITIKTFSATKDGERSSRLDWTSSSEINSDYIGSTDGEDWTTVGYVKAAGNSNRDIDYIYYRSLPMARSIDNIFYYRLRLTDLDGQYDYSETRGVNMGRLEGLVSIYPNPATDIINVDLTDMDLHEGIIHLSVYDNTGKAIISKEVNGAGIEPIQASNMAAGSYQVVVKQGDTTHRKQIIVVN